MNKMKLFAALLALAVSLAGCNKAVDGDPIKKPKPESMLDGDNMIASSKQEYQEPEDVAYIRMLSGESEDLVCVLYLGGSYEVSTDPRSVLRSQEYMPWDFIYDIPEDHCVVAPGGGCDLYCIFTQNKNDTLFVYEQEMTDDLEEPLKRGEELYCGSDGQPILLLCNYSDIVPNTQVEVYCQTGRTLSWSPQLSGENGCMVQVEGVRDFSSYPQYVDEEETGPLELEGNWLECFRDTDEGAFDTDPEDADRMCFIPLDVETEGNQIPLSVSLLTTYEELNVLDAELFYNEGTPEVPFDRNQQWYATFTDDTGTRYALTLEDEDTLALKVYLEGEMSYLSLVNTVYFARQEGMG